MTEQRNPGAENSGVSYVQVNDLRVGYIDSGAGPPLILIHGGLATSAIMWGQRIPELARRYRVLAPDSRGHGHTDNPAATLSYQQMADDVAGFCTALGLEQPLVLGYSDGAQVGIELGLRHPALARALVLGGIVTQQTESYLATLREMGCLGPGRFEHETFARLYPDFFELIKTSHGSMYGPDYWRGFLSQIAELWYSVPSYSDEQLASIIAPTLALSGDRDALDEAVRLYKALPNAELGVIPNADHGAGETPLFWQMVDEFLARQVNAGAA
jgi:pimeloyl-ACP methyl ester carboxylesterase